jgi:hypothetical protein
MATIAISPTYGLLCYARGGVGSSCLTGDTPTLPEIHLNIWEREERWLRRAAESSLDIGLMIDVLDKTQSIELIFPSKVPLSNVEDLSAVVSTPSAVPAIFNESWAVNSMGTQGTDSVVHDPANSNMAFAIVSTVGALREESHLGYDALSIDIPFLITKGHNVANALRWSISRVYIRFRILEIPRRFYCVGAGMHNEDWWMPLWQRTEDIDFRLNVRRGAPAGLETHIGRFVEFSKVHLFLMRSRDKDIVFQDKLFNSSRSLEDEGFWAQYSLVGPSTAKSLRVSRERVQNSLGYHWKAKPDPANPTSVKEFATLARFKIVEFGIGKFLLVALLLGAAGNALWDGVQVLWSMSNSAKPHPTAAVDTKPQEAQANAVSDGARALLPPGVKLGPRKEPK